MAKRRGRDARREIRDKGEAGHLNAAGVGENGLGDRAHADDVRTHVSVHVDFRRRLEDWTRREGVDAFHHAEGAAVG